MVTQGFPVEPPRALRERSDLSHDTRGTAPRAWVAVGRRGVGMFVRGGDGGFAPAGHRGPRVGGWRCDGRPHDRPVSALSIAGSARPFRLGPAMSPGVTHGR